MEYNAVYEINGGVSHGFGLKYPDVSRRSEIIEADNDKDAYRKAMKTVDELAYDHLSNPETNLTKVTLLSLSRGIKEVNFDRKEAVASRTTLEHIVKVFVESDN